MPIGPGMISDDAVMDRIVILLRHYLNDQLELVDDTANTIEGAAYVRDTPRLDDADVIPFWDSDPSQGSLRVIVQPEATRIPREFQTEGAGVGQARRDSDHQLSLFVRSDDASDSDLMGAYRRAARVATAAIGVLVRFPRLDVPDRIPALPALAAWTVVGQTGRAPSDGDGPPDLTSIVIPVTVRTLRTVRTS